MGNIPTDGRKQSRDNWPKDYLIWVLIWPVAGVPAAVLYFVILLPTIFFPHYIALPLIFALGMIALLLPLGMRRKLTKGVVFFSTLIWGGLVCVEYDYILSPQR